MQSIGVKRSGKYLELFERLKHSIHNAADIAEKLYKQGTKDGLSKDQIRNDIDSAYKAIGKIIGERQFRRLLPQELKHQEKVRSLRTYMTANVATEGHKFVNSDNVTALKEMPNESIHLVVTSPPYDELRDYNGHNKWDFEALAQQLYRVLVPGGIVCWNVNVLLRNVGMATYSQNK